MDPRPAILTLAEPLGVAPPDPQVPSLAHRIFFGRFGFRAGWGIAIFLAIASLLTVVSGLAALGVTGQLKPFLAVGAQAHAHPGAPKPHFEIAFTPAVVIANDGINFCGLFAMCWVFSKAERRRLGSYGIGSQRFSDFFPGAFWGLASLSTLVLILHSLHLLYFDALLLHGPAIFLFGLKWLIALLFVGLSEEYQLRGYLQYTLTRGALGLSEKISPQRARLIAFWISATVLSFLFGALHLSNEGENVIGITQVVVVGFVFSYALWRTGSLWWSIGWHMAWDWAQNFLYGVPDSGNVSVGRLFQTHISGKPLLSGGVDGPEGSLFSVPILLLVIVIIRFTTRPGVQPPFEQIPPGNALPPELPVVIA